MGPAGLPDTTIISKIDSLESVINNLDSAITYLSSLFAFGCTDPIALNYDSNATVDDGSCQILQIGDMYQGGMIFYLDGNGGGLIMSDVSPSAFTHMWGCMGQAVGTYTSIGMGYNNTQLILGHCPQNAYAAISCYNYTGGGYTDWFLPSKDELELMYLNIKAVGLDQNLNNPIQDYPYWSSSEPMGTGGAAAVAWYCNMTSGQMAHYSKSNPFYVRPIREF